MRISNRTGSTAGSEQTYCNFACVGVQGLSLFLVSATSPSLERWQNDMFAAVDILSLLRNQVQDKATEVCILREQVPHT